MIHYFGTKKQLYATVIRAAIERLSDVVRTDLRRLPPEEMVRRNVGELLQTFETDSETWALLYGAQGNRDPEVSEALGEARRATRERMARNHMGGAKPTEQMLTATEVFQGAGMTAVNAWLAGRLSREDLRKYLTATITTLAETAHELAGN